MARNWSANVSMVYWICTAMGKPKPSYAIASRIASKYCFFELDRIYKHVKSRSKTKLIIA
jgi:hypothetical protein